MRNTLYKSTDGTDMSAGSGLPWGQPQEYPPVSQQDPDAVREQRTHRRAMQPIRTHAHRPRHEGRKAEECEDTREVLTADLHVRPDFALLAASRRGVAVWQALHLKISAFPLQDFSQFLRELAPVLLLEGFPTGPILDFAS